MGRIGTASRVFNSVSELNINIPFITQASSETSICFAIDNINTDRAISAIKDNFINEINCCYIQNINKILNTSLITLIGANMIKNPIVMGNIFSELGKNNINIIAISQGSSEISITIVVHTSNELNALNIIHDFISKNEEQNNSKLSLGSEK